jgi:cytochrome c oxidase subunit 2
MRARSLLCVLSVVGLILAVPTAVAYDFFPQAKSELQRDWQALFTKIFWVALAVFVLVEGIILYAIIRFRKRKDGPSEGPHVHGNTKMEIAWTIAPTLVMAWLLVVSLDQMQKTDTDTPTPDVELQIVGHQFYWEVFYPDGSGPFVNKIYVEEDKVVGVHVTSADVIHAFSIRELGVMVDAVPGRMNYFWFRADEPGTYATWCRELCGASHGEMEFNEMLVVFPAGSQDKPYGLPSAAAPTTGATNATAPTNGTAPAGPPADAFDVKLIDFAIEPKDHTAEPDSKIVLNVKNDADKLHNLYIGKFDSAAENSGALWFTPDIDAGKSALLEVQLPAEAGAWEWWCNVPGHRGLSTGGKLGEGAKPLLPGFELPLVLAAALGAAFFAARRRT